MTTEDLQDALRNMFDTAADAREEVEGDDDDITLADFMRDIVNDMDAIASAKTFDDAGLLTSNEGLVVRTAEGDEFQITIVQSRFAR